MLGRFGLGEGGVRWCGGAENLIAGKRSCSKCAIVVLQNINCAIRVAPKVGKI